MKWKQIVGFSNYSVSDEGFVRNDVTGRVLKAGRANKTTGHRKVYLYGAGKGRATRYVHRLVAEAFIPNPDNLPQVLHKCATTIALQNDKASNLYWGTPKENVADCIRDGHGRQRAILQYYIDGSFIQTYPSIKEAVKTMGKTSNNAIFSCLTGVTSQAYGYVWRYENELA